MKEFVDVFKVGVGNLMDEMYRELDDLLNDAILNMSCCDGDIDEHYAMLQNAMIEVLQEKLAGLYNKFEESN